MSLVGDSERDAGIDVGLRSGFGSSANSRFRFVPKELAAKSSKLIESYHAIHGYGCLPDMLWHSDARDIIECHSELAQIFKNASRSRCAKRANESLLLIATVIASLEVLTRDFAGWGKRFPLAKRDAESLLAEFSLRPRQWFMDLYLYPAADSYRGAAGALAPSAAEPVTA